jgi:hypothetical protein
MADPGTAVLPVMPDSQFATGIEPAKAGM